MADIKVWDVNSIRKEFLDYFENKGHKIVPSAPMVLKNDPTLMFTNAGMNQFKDVFLGNSKPISPRVADSQKCLRVSGKHNDLEEVGVDTYHHTMFEMLGNWSFGDYFKENAIDWAWELLTEVYKIDKSRLYITVFEGYQKDETTLDTESEKFWKKHISADRILRCGKKDNFWEMGENGPCGPCSEIHVDIRSDADRKLVDGKSLVNMDHPQVIEIWNLVFIEFNRKSDRKLEQLPQKHVDTGLGLERLAMVLQGKQSNYQTDVFQSILDKLVVVSGKEYLGKDSKSDIAFRVIADHIRAVAFSIADGQLPANTGAGYVIRRILRRGIRYGYSFLGFRKSFIYELVPIMVKQMGHYFPELLAQSSLISKVIKEEEESFLNTLSKGLLRLEKLTQRSRTISGKDAFELYDTYGFPIDLTQLIASEKNIAIDISEFNIELKKQKERSKSKNAIKAGDWTIVSKDIAENRFVGYDELSTEVQITRYRQISEKGKTLYHLILNQTPFYPEGGGQVGDKGFIVKNDIKIKVVNTLKENELVIHKVLSLPDELSGSWQASVNVEDRSLIESNHSATHLLHFALRKVLGVHVEQKGSLVDSKHLRFDFSHFKKLSKEEIVRVEVEVNLLIDSQIALEDFRSIPIKEAKDRGAMSLFGEKYGEEVRMIQFGNSLELCGGTHVQNTGNIRRLKIVSESSVASGIRRVEAITNKTAFAWYNSQISLLNEVKEALKYSDDVLKSLEELQIENNDFRKKIEELELAEAHRTKQKLITQIENINGYNILIDEVSLSSKQVKDLAFQLSNEVQNLIIVIGNKDKTKAGLTVMFSESTKFETGLNARNIIKDISHHINGGGGGQDFFATAGGKNQGGIKSALQAAKVIVESILVKLN